MPKRWLNTCNSRGARTASIDLGGGAMASGERRDYLERAAGAFEPVSEMLDSGRCEPLKAAVHGVLLVTVSVCAAYNAAAWLKRRQSHLAINAIIYSAAVW